MAGAAHADDLTLRLDVPGVAVAGNDGWFQMIGGGATWRRAPVEAELAADVWINACVSGLTYTARGGVAPAVVQGGRWTVRAALLGGASASPLSGGGCDANPDEQLYALTGAAGLEAVRWGPHKGFSLRALGFAGEQSFQRGLASTHPEREWRAIYGVTVSLGIALPLSRTAPRAVAGSAN
jgi:hypothetical protein